MKLLRLNLHLNQERKIFLSANTTSSKASNVEPEILSAPPFVVVTIKLPLASVLKPYISADDTPVRFEPSPINDVAVNVPVTVAPELVVSNFLLLS